MIADISKSDLKDVFVCPVCHGLLSISSLGNICNACNTSYTSLDGYIDFGPNIKMKSTGIGQFMLQDPLLISRYETDTRPAFLNIMGGNWDGELTQYVEDDYIKRGLANADGPVLDLACGAGRWTRTIVDVVGQNRVIGLDLSIVMLKKMQNTVPGVLLVRADAAKLPINTASLSAVNCSNALQLFPNPPAVIKEVARCLKEGGTFTVSTYRNAKRPLQRYFQKQHESAFDVTSFAEEDIRKWLADSQMELIDISGPQCFLFFTARRLPIVN
jgi:SAM-dependent methyltransferase